MLYLEEIDYKFRISSYNYIYVCLICIISNEQKKVNNFNFNCNN